MWDSLGLPLSPFLYPLGVAFGQPKFVVLVCCNPRLLFLGGVVGLYSCCKCKKEHGRALGTDQCSKQMHVPMHLMQQPPPYRVNNTMLAPAPWKGETGAEKKAKAACSYCREKLKEKILFTFMTNVQIRERVINFFPDPPERQQCG